jgi:hypothetical protein
MLVVFSDIHFYVSAGINTLINIMSRFGKNTETESNITHNERLEFLGDAVVEFLTSIHLFHMFPDLEEGGLATYRAAIVQNQHLAVLAKVRTRVEHEVQCVICPLYSREKVNTVMVVWVVALCR